MTHEVARDQEIEISIPDLFRVILDKIAYIIMLAVLFGALAVVYVFNVTPIYQSTVSILVRPMTNSTSIDSMFSGGSSSGSQIATEIELIKSEAVVMDALSLLDLNSYTDEDDIPFSKKIITASELKSMISVAQSSSTRNVTISVKNSNKQFATDYANALATSFKKLLSDLSKQSSRAQILTIENQIPEAEKSLTESLDDLAKFKTENGTDQMINKISVLTSEIALIQMQQSPLTLQYNEAIDKIQITDKNYYKNDRTVKELLALFEQNYKELVLYLSVGENSNPSRQYALESQINSIYNSIADRIASDTNSIESAKNICDVLSIESRTKVLKEVEKLYSDELASYQIIQGRLQEKTKEVEVNQQLVLSLKTMLEESRVVESAVENNVSIIDTAKVPKNPVSPQKTKTCFIAAVVGAFVGVAIFILEFLFDRSIKSEDDIRRIIGESVPFLGWVPYVTRSSNEESQDLLTVKYGDNYCVERYRLIASNLEFLSQNKKKVLVVNSSDMGEGKTTVTANLAAVLASNGKKVLVIDGDLRRPELEHTFNIAKCQYGLTNVLIDNKALEDAIVQPLAQFPDLHMLAAGHVTKNTNLVFQSKQFAELIKKLRTMYDYIFIDCPPLSYGSDFTIAAKNIDGFIFNIRAGYATKDQLIDFKNNIDLIPAPMIGYIFYGVIGSAGSYGYGYNRSSYGYGYGYGYGYSYGYGYGYEGKGNKKRGKKLNYKKIQKMELKQRVSKKKAYGTYKAPLVYAKPKK